LGNCLVFKGLVLVLVSLFLKKSIFADLKSVESQGKKTSVRLAQSNSFWFGEANGRSTLARQPELPAHKIFYGTWITAHGQQHFY